MNPLETLKESAREFEEKFPNIRLLDCPECGLDHFDGNPCSVKSHIKESTIKLLQSQIEARKNMKKEEDVEMEGKDFLSKGFNLALQACNEADRELIKELTK